MGQYGTWWKICITIVSSTFLLLFVLSIPIVSAAPYRQTKGQVSVQGTPTVDPTVTALEKQKLSLEVDQLQRNLNNLTLILSTIIPAIILVSGVTIGFGQWRVERRNDAEKRLEERFQVSKVQILAEPISTV